MKIDIRDLLGSVPAVKALAARVGLPDSPTLVEIANPGRFGASLDAAMRAFHELRPGTQTLVSADLNEYLKTVSIRILQAGPSPRDGDGNVEAPLTRSFTSLRTIVKRNKGEFQYWGGDNFITVLLPYPHIDREAFPEVKHLPWNERYRHLLERESWQSLRDRVFRFADLATILADRCRAWRMTTVLIPSVGLCVHPWLFANRGLTVTATDSATTALAALSEPGFHPNLYSSAAYERWDISNCAAFAMIPHPDHFDGMPALEDAHVRETLRQRIAFEVADWACLPVPSGTLDLVFATNAIPRESEVERISVFKEWVRVLRPDGVVFIAQHHADVDWGIESFFLERGFVEIDFLQGEDPAKTGRGGFQIRHTSG